MIVLYKTNNKTLYFQEKKGRNVKFTEDINKAKVFISNTEATNFNHDHLFGGFEYKTI